MTDNVSHSQYLATAKDAMEQGDFVTAYDNFALFHHHHPDDAPTASNMVFCLVKLTRYQQAKQIGLAFLRAYPRYWPLYIHVAMLLIRLGEWPQGFALYEARVNLPNVIHLKELAQKLPIWNGTSLPAGQSLLISSEQGLGDGLMFARFLPVLAQSHPQMPLYYAGIKPDFCDLLSHSPSLAGINLVPIADKGKGVAITATGPAPRAISFLLSLPHHLKTTPDNLPPPLSLSVPESRQAKWQQLLAGHFGNAQMKARPLIGLSLSGNLQRGDDLPRNIDLDQLMAFLPQPESAANYVVLQKGLSDKTRRQLNARPDIFVAEDTGQLTDLLDAAALTQAMTMVISIDNLFVHLAGCLGVPVKLMLPEPAEWRWGLAPSHNDPQKGEACLWYPCATIFRQPQAGDWQGAFQNLQAHLKAHLPIK